jgi:hypothetical protein
MSPVAGKGRFPQRLPPVASVLQPSNDLRMRWHETSGRSYGHAVQAKGGKRRQTRAEFEALVEVPGEFTAQSRRSLRLSGSPPHGKLLIPLARRDVRVVEGARLQLL